MLKIKSPPISEGFLFLRSFNSRKTGRRKYFDFKDTIEIEQMLLYKLEDVNKTFLGLIS